MAAAEAGEPMAVAVYWDSPTVILTPHVSTGGEDRDVGRVVSILLANLARVLHGEPPLTAVDRQRGY